MFLIILRNILSCLHLLPFNPWTKVATIPWMCGQCFMFPFISLSRTLAGQILFIAQSNETPRDLPKQDVFLLIAWFPCVVSWICCIGSVHSAQTSLYFTVKFSVGWSVSFRIPLTTSTNTGWMALWKRKIIIFLSLFHFMFHRGEKPQSRQNQSCPK